MFFNLYIFFVKRQRIKAYAIHSVRETPIVGHVGYVMDEHFSSNELKRVVIQHLYHHSIIS